MKNNPHKMGITLIELLIGIALSGLVFIAASSLMFVLFTSNNRSRQTDDIEQTRNDITQELNAAVSWGHAITILGTAPVNSLVIDGKTYGIVSGRLVKNGIPLTSSAVKITGFSVANKSATRDYISLEIIIDMEHSQFSVFKDSLRLVISQRFGISILLRFAAFLSEKAD